MKKALLFSVLAGLFLSGCAPMMHQTVYRERVCSWQNGVRNCEIVERIVETNDPLHGAPTPKWNLLVDRFGGIISVGSGGLGLVPGGVYYAPRVLDDLAFVPGPLAPSYVRDQYVKGAHFGGGHRAHGGDHGRSGISSKWYRR